MYRGYFYQAKCELDRAMADFNRTIDIDPNDASTYNGRGYVYYTKAEYDLAVAEYDKAIEIDPKNVLAYTRFPWLYFAQWTLMP